MSKVKEHAEVFESAVARVAQVLGFTTPAAYIHDRGTNPRGAGFLAVEVLAELRAAGWELTYRNAEDAA